MKLARKHHYTGCRFLSLCQFQKGCLGIAVSSQKLTPCIICEEQMFAEEPETNSDRLLGVPSNERLSSN